MVYFAVQHMQVCPLLLLSVLEPSGLEYICYSTKFNKTSLTEVLGKKEASSLEWQGKAALCRDVCPWAVNYSVSSFWKEILISNERNA